ncbi:peptidylprolyl isomerase [Phakopsora pachyrhizi]|uniref:FK506-binding protein n=1 Tax=Phakopsora pachyrhizi TaxID=170000 RepID=A0AAV0AQH4_PHAPC|nr:peptidylprolyl isomerase [Phakopsora pachyrhizi]
MSDLFSAVVKPNKPFFYNCAANTLISSIAVYPVDSSKVLTTLQPFVTFLKLQYEGHVIHSGEDSDDEEESKTEKNKKDKKPKKSKKDADEEEEDDNDDSDSNDSDDDESSIFEVKETVIGCFTPNALQITTEILLESDELYQFIAVGSPDYEVHLFGRFYQAPGAESQDDYDSEDSEEDDDLDDSELGLIMGEEEEESDEDRIQEIDSDDEQAVTEKKKAESKAKSISESNAGSSKANQKKADEEKNPKKRALEEKVDGLADVSMADSVDDSAKLSKSQRKKLKKMKASDAQDDSEKKEEKKAAESEKKEAKSTDASAKPDSKSIVTLPSGLKIQDTKVGQGADAKPGQRVLMRYIGKLANNKVFDSNTKGKPFVFKLGKGEVIKGWDEGIKGMKPGGERRLTIPANLAYGKSGSPPDIPPNATLTFDVKLLGVK